MKKVSEYTDTELEALKVDRKAWAALALDNDMKGTAREWQLTVALIEEVLELRWQQRLRFEELMAEINGR